MQLITIVVWLEVGAPNFFIEETGINISQRK